MDVLLEEWSPVCSIQAVVEDNGQAVYFYLWVNPGSENAEIRNCWICNRVPAMEDMDYEAMKMGMAPRMPRAYVTHDSAGICLDREKLSLVWFEEGDGAALYEDGRPGISGIFPIRKGYGALCLGASGGAACSGTADGAQPDVLGHYEGRIF